MLLDARRRERVSDLLDVGRGHHGLDLAEGEASVLVLLSEALHGREVDEARVPVLDVGGEEFPEAPLGAFGRREEYRRRHVAGGRGGLRGAFGRDELGKHGTGVCTDPVVRRGRNVAYKCDTHFGVRLSVRAFSD